ncbi:hypothetical protein BDV59DRAFT_174461 [Aspergillus ambiguus]|uniref:uncharacterized protein n=1 Tax=Aspergillus ambiguus TaxID=176160 RepID=UPI003CCD05B9
MGCLEKLLSLGLRCPIAQAYGSLCSRLLAPSGRGDRKSKQLTSPCNFHVPSGPTDASCHFPRSAPLTTLRISKCQHQHLGWLTRILWSISLD